MHEHTFNESSQKGKLLKIVIWKNNSNPDVPTPQVFFKLVDRTVTRMPSVALEGKAKRQVA